MDSLARDILAQFAPPPLYKPSEFIDKFRWILSGPTPFPGKWDTSRFEFHRGIIDAIADKEIEMISVIKSSQVGITELLNNIAYFFIVTDPCPILIVQPSDGMALVYSKDRFAHMVRDNPDLSELIKPPRTKDSENTILHKQFPGGSLNIASAQSPSQLASRPVRIILADELDRFKASAKQEGDPVDLAVKRSTAFWNRKIVLVSTPTIKDLSRIEAAFAESDKRYFMVPCVFCGKTQVLKWSNVIWESQKPESAMYQCKSCKKKWNDSQRWKSISKGHWQITKPQVKKHAGFFINEIYSPLVTLADMVDRWLKSQGYPERLKVFVNTSLAEVYDDNPLQKDHIVLFNSRERYPAEVPKGVLLLIASVDVQDDRFEGEIVGYGKEYESWGIEYFNIRGDMTKKTIWEELEKKITKTYEHELGFNIRVSAAGIDTGGHYTDEVYKFCKPRWHKNVFALKGSNQLNRPIAGKPTKSNRMKVNLYSVGTDTAKELLFARLDVAEPGPSFMHFPDTYTEDYFEMLTSERPKIKYRNGYPIRVWIKANNARNESLDIRVYNLAVLSILNPNFIEIEKRYREYLEPSEKTEEVRRIRPPGRNWVDKWKK